MERKRIFRRKTWLFIGLLFSVNMLLYCISLGILGGSKTDEENKIDEEHKNITEFIYVINSQSISDIGQYMKRREDLLGLYEDKNADLIEKEVVKKLLLRQNYAQMVSGIIENVGIQNNISIFNNNNSEKNKEKTILDYSRIADVDYEIDDDYAVEKIFDIRYPEYILLILILLIVWLYNDDREKLWQLVHQTPNGRYVLFARRVIILAATSIAGSLILHGSMLAFSTLHYGNFAIINKPMQCMEMFYRVPYRLTVLQIMAIHSFYSACAVFVLGMMFWLCNKIIKSSSVSVAFFVIICAIFWWLKSNISDASNIMILRYINPFTILMSDEWIDIYLNINFGGIYISRYLVVFLGSLLLIAVSILLNAIVTDRKPFVNFNFTMPRVFYYVISKLSFLYKGLLGELTKLLYYQKVILLLLLVLLMTVNNKKVSGIKLNFGIDDFNKQEIYEEYSGIITEELFQWYEGMKNEHRDNKRLIDEIDKQNSEGMLSENEYINKRGSLSWQNLVLENKLSFFGEQIDYIQQYKQVKNVDLYFIDESGYEAFLGKDNYSKLLNIGLITSIVATLIGGIVFSQEHKPCMNCIIKSSPARGNVWKNKLLLIFVLDLVVWCFSYGMHLFNMLDIYKLKDFNAPVQSIRLLSEFPLSVSIGGFIFLLYLFRYLILVAVSFIIATLSDGINVTKGAGMVAVIFGPMVLDYLGMRSISFLSIAEILGFSYLWNNYENSAKMWIPLIILILMSTVTLVYWLFKIYRGYYETRTN